MRAISRISVLFLIVVFVTGWAAAWPKRKTTQASPERSKRTRLLTRRRDPDISIPNWTKSKSQSTLSARSLVHHAPSSEGISSLIQGGGGSSQQALSRQGSTASEGSSRPVVFRQVSSTSGGSSRSTLSSQASTTSDESVSTNAPPVYSVLYDEINQETALKDFLKKVKSVVFVSPTAIAYPPVFNDFKRAMKNRPNDKVSNFVILTTDTNKKSANKWANKWANQTGFEGYTVLTFRKDNVIQYRNRGLFIMAHETFNFHGTKFKEFMKTDKPTKSYVLFQTGIILKGAKPPTKDVVDGGGLSHLGIKPTFNGTILASLPRWTGPVYENAKSIIFFKVTSRSAPNVSAFKSMIDSVAPGKKYLIAALDLSVFDNSVYNEFTVVALNEIDLDSLPKPRIFYINTSKTHSDLPEFKAAYDRRFTGDTIIQCNMDWRPPQ